MLCQCAGFSWKAHFHLQSLSRLMLGGWITMQIVINNTEKHFNNVFWLVSVSLLKWLMQKPRYLLGLHLLGALRRNLVYSECYFLASIIKPEHVTLRYQEAGLGLLVFYFFCRATKRLVSLHIFPCSSAVCFTWRHLNVPFPWASSKFTSWDQEGLFLNHQTGELLIFLVGSQETVGGEELLRLRCSCQMLKLWMCWRFVAENGWTRLWWISAEHRTEADIVSLRWSCHCAPS